MFGDVGHQLIHVRHQSSERSRPLALSVRCAMAVIAGANCAVAQGATAVTRAYGPTARGAQQSELSSRSIAVIERSGQDEDIGPVHGVRLLTNNIIAVANASTKQILVFDGSARLRARMGRTGRGPGEFPVLWRLLSVGDTLIGIGSDARSELFTMQGRRVVGRPRPVLAQGAGADRIGVLADGRQVILARRVPDAEGDTDTTAAYLVALESPQGSTTAVWTVPRTSLERTPAGIQATRGMMFAPFGQVAAAGDRICATYSTAWVVRCVDPTGRLVLTVTRSVEGGPLPEAAKVFAADAYRASNPTAPRAEIDAEIRRFRFAAKAPVTGRLIVADNGDVWMSEFFERMGRVGPGPLAAPVRPLLWHVFDRSGQWLADVTLPARFYPYDVGRTRVAGVSFDDDDVERVTVWEIGRRRR